MKSSAIKKVLVVEDEEDVRTYLSTLFFDMGFEVDDAGDGREAMQKTRAMRPDLITLDIVMPQSTGIKFYRELKNDPVMAGIPVIIITGLQKDFEAFIYKHQTVAPQGYINKPFNQESLRAEVERVLGVALKIAVG